MDVFYSEDERKKRKGLDILKSFERLRQLQKKEEEAKELFKQQEEEAREHLNPKGDLKDQISDLDDELLS